jgi:C-terminal processing protease CtpA/Prc
MRKLILVSTLITLLACQAHGDQIDNTDVIADPIWKKFITQVENSFFIGISSSKLNEICLKIAPKKIPSEKLSNVLEHCLIKALEEIDTSSKYLTSNELSNIAKSARLGQPKLSTISFQDEVLKIRLPQFTEEDTHELASKLVTEVQLASARKVVIDLRGNPGGLLTSLAHISSFFVQPGEAILLTNGRSSESNVRLVSSNEYGKSKHQTEQIRKDLSSAKIYVLIDNMTGSGAEALALLLKTKRGATLIGKKSFGNADIHTIIPIGIDGALKLKTAEMRIPGHPSWAGKGLTPDVELEFSDEITQLPDDVLF